MGDIVTYDPQVFIPLILDRLTSGETLLAICKTEGYPTRNIVQDWAERVPGFSVRYARARGIGLDAIAEQIIDIADTDGDAQRARNRMDARKWTLSKLRPDKYGDRVALDHRFDGDITRLDQDALRKLAESLEQIAFDGDQGKLEEWRAKAMEPVGLIEATATESTEEV